MLDKESAELEAMRAAARKVAREAEDGGVFASAASGESPVKGNGESKPGEQCSCAGLNFFIA